jgi:hypothetical protein
MSAVVARLSRIICKPEIADPMGGFFATAEGSRGGSTAPFRTGFKIFLDILASSLRPLRVSELPYQASSAVDGTALGPCSFAAEGRKSSRHR